MKFLLGIFVGCVFGFIMFDVFLNEMKIYDTAGIDSIKCMKICKRRGMKTIAHLPSDKVDCVCYEEEK